jgi:hypothetical protein
VLLIVGNVYAYKARNVPTTFQESRWIGLSFASMLQLFLLGVPVVFAVSDDPTARTLMMISVIFLNNIVLVGAIMFPKLYIYYLLDDGAGIDMTTTNGTHNGGYAGKSKSELITLDGPSYQEDSGVETWDHEALSDIRRSSL